MSKPIDDGGPAFPRPPVNIPQGMDARDYWFMQDGMSRRDWLAGMALPFALKETSWLSRATLKDRGHDSREAAAAALAYRAADAMIAEGRKERGDD